MLSPLLRFAQPPRHLLVLRSVISPALGGSAPAIVADRHVDAAVDKELHGLVVFVKVCQFMQDAGRLMGAPVRVDIGAMPEKKVGDLEVVVEDRPGERGVEDLLHTGLAPLQIPAREGTVSWKMIRWVAQCRLAGRVEPAPHAWEVSSPGRVSQIVG